MENLHFNLGNQSANQHVCQSQRDGDWIIFTCSKCPDYERRVNWRTGQMSVTHGLLHVAHIGTHLPAEIAYALRHIN